MSKMPERPRSREAIFEEAQRLIAHECDAMKAMLLKKNMTYGSSVLHPIRAASKASPTERIRSRIDDKINRLVNGVDDDEDTLNDLAGYIILLRCAEAMEKDPSVLGAVEVGEQQFDSGGNLIGVSRPGYTQRG